MKVKLNRVIAYGGKEHAPGDVIEMDDVHAKVNIFNGRVSAVEDEKPQRETLTRKTRHMEAEAKPEANEEDKPKAKDKGKYKRRDERAEGDE